MEGHFQLRDGMQLYVNRGIGAVNLPFRFRSPPKFPSSPCNRAPNRLFRFFACDFMGFRAESPQRRMRFSFCPIHLVSCA